MRPPGGSWGAPVTLSTELNFGVGGLVLAMDGSGNAIAVFGSSYSWRLEGGSWGTAASLPAGSSGGLVAADPPAPSCSPTAAATRSGSQPAPPASAPAADRAAAWATLKIVPGRAAMLAANAVSTETVS